jgi:transcription termination/antitermination protein NusA
MFHLQLEKAAATLNLQDMLIGMEIDVFRDIDEEEEDVLLTEFSDEIDIGLLKPFAQLDVIPPKAYLQFLYRK